ncbi:MAG TPA: GNAT family protein [Planctomycetota bacterium]|nr:GNAT family protein [Planctomycetota bacterium]
MKTPFLIGDRICLRPLEREDARVLEFYINDPDVTRTLQAYRPMNLQIEEDWIADLYKKESDIVLGIAIKSSDKLIGATGLHRLEFKDRRAEFGISIGAKEEWDKGYGTEATRLIVGYGFETLNLNRISLRVYEHNPRAQRAYEKAGFKKEGVLRKEVYRLGRYWDTIVMGILREEWDALAASKK